MNYIYGCSTDVGIRKKVNQDALGAGSYVSENVEAFFAVICDGVGGLDCGELASSDTVNYLLDWFKYEFPQMAGAKAGEADLCERIRYILSNQNERLRNYGKERNLNLGTTVSILLCSYPYYYIWHVGDSRIYMINDKIYQITKDQSLVQQEVDMGIITAEQAKYDKRRNILLHSMGAEKNIEPLFYKGTFESGDVFLLCTDGLVHEIEEEELLFLFGKHHEGDKKWIEDSQRRLIQYVKDKGEKDNISVITVRAENNCRMKELGIMKINLVLGDITELKDIDVIVNAANKSLLGGGGVDGVIHKKAGLGLMRECMKLHGCKTGEAKITSACKLKYKAIIHTVGPVYDSKNESSETLLADCYRNSMQLAFNNNLYRVAFPCISTGVYRYPQDEACNIAVSTIQEFLEIHPEMEVTFCCFKKSDYELYKEKLGYQKVY